MDYQNTTSHYLTKCPLYTEARTVVSNSLLYINVETQCNILVYGDTLLTIEENQAIFNAVQTFIIASKMFDYCKNKNFNMCSYTCICIYLILLDILNEIQTEGTAS